MSLKKDGNIVFWFEFRIFVGFIGPSSFRRQQLPWRPLWLAWATSIGWENTSQVRWVRNVQHLQSPFRNSRSCRDLNTTSRVSKMSCDHVLCNGCFCWTSWKFLCFTGTPSSKNGMLWQRYATAFRQVKKLPNLAQISSLDMLQHFKRHQMNLVCFLHNLAIVQPNKIGKTR